MATLPFLSMGMILFLFYCSAIAGTAPANQGYSKYRDPHQPVNARIRDLMQRMTLQEKIGQMTQVDYSVVTPITLRNYSISGVLCGGGSVLFPKVKARDWMDMVNKYQNGSLSSCLRIPIIYGIDAVHGHNNVYQATIFPHNVGLGATRDPDLMKRIGAATALEVMVPYNHTVFIDTLTQLVNSNKISTSRIDDASKRILRVKFVMGLFENPMGNQAYLSQLGSQEHRDLAREAVRKSLVLLENGHDADAPVLQLAKNAPEIIVARTHATIWAINVVVGPSLDRVEVAITSPVVHSLSFGTTIPGAISKAVDLDTEVVFSENPNTDFIKSHNFSYAIIVVGELPSAETAGDSTNMTLVEPGKDIISNMCSSVKCVVIVVSGRSVMMEPLMAQMDALVAASLAGSKGEEVADVLFEDYGFTAKSPMTWFKTVDQLPMNVGDPHYDPLFPFGLGLTTEPIGGQ